MNDNLKLFMYTMEEYMRFSSKGNIHQLTDSYTDDDYISINTRLIILRKYGNENEPVYIKNIIGEAKNKYSEIEDKLNKLLSLYQNIETEKFEYRLSNGERLNLYKTIEDVMYGMYLHADFNRINRLRIQNEKMRFAAVRKYVEEFENILFDLYQLLKNYVTDYGNNSNSDIADVIYLGDEEKQEKKISSKFWSNLNGKDIDIGELNDMLNKETTEDSLLLEHAMIFVLELKKENMSVEILESLIYPYTRDEWGDFKSAKEYYNNIKMPGISSKVRYNDRHNVAYIRIMSNIENLFMIDSPHLIPSVSEICFYKENDEIGWKIYSFGEHIEDVSINDD